MHRSPVMKKRTREEPMTTTTLIIGGTFIDLRAPHVSFVEAAAETDISTESQMEASSFLLLAGI